MDFIERSFLASVSELRTLSELFSNNAFMTSQDFKFFVHPILSRHREILALKWIPRVAAQDRDQFEATARQKGFKNFKITERQNGQTVAAKADRKEYFPVYFSETFKNAKAVLGANIAASATHLKSLELARDTGKLVATERITLDQETTKEYGIMVLEPVYDAGYSLDTVEARRLHLLGFILGVFRVNKMIESSASKFSKTEQLKISVFDEDAVAGKGQIYPVQALSGMLTGNPNLTCVNRQVSLSNRNWRVTFCPPKDNISFKEQRFAGWLVFGFGMIFTGLAALYRSAQLSQQKSPQFVLINRAQSVVLLALLFFSIFFGTMSKLMIDRIEAGKKSDVKTTLVMALQASHDAVRLVFEGQKSLAQVWSSNETIIQAVEELLQLPKNPKILTAHAAQDRLRSSLRAAFKIKSYRGFFVVDQDGINIASNQEASIGAKNVLQKQALFLQKIRAGQTLVSLPQISDVHLNNVFGERVLGMSTMFVAAPIINAGGEVIAVLALRIEPDTSFSPAFVTGRFGKTGEAYAFAADGTLLSESLFVKQLYEHGLSKDEFHSALGLKIKNPEVNLVADETPSLSRAEQPFTKMAESALHGNTGLDLEGYRDYRGVQVVGAWTWDAELGFGIAAEIEVKEIYASLERTKSIFILFTALLLFFLAMLILVFMRNQRKLFENEEKYRNSIRATSEGYWRVDADLLLLEVNDAFCKMLGRTPEELVGHRASEFTHKDFRQTHREMDPENATLDQRQYEATFLNKERALVYAHISATTIRKNGEATGAFAFITDISERKELERERDFQKFAMDEHAIVSISNAQGDITYANDKFCTISGFTREELIGQNHRILNSGEHPPEFFVDLWTTISSGKVWRGNIKNLKKGGGTYWVYATIVPFLNEHGTPFQYIAIRTDITSRMNALDEAKHANEAKSDFLSSMSHELRTPMNAILGFGQMLKFNPKEPLSESQEECVSMIMKGGHHLLELINEILDLAKIEAGKVDLQFESITPQDVIEDCFLLVFDMAADHGIQIKAIDKTVPCVHVFADRTRLKQVLLNYLSNAIKYNQRNGSVEVTLETMEYIEGRRIRINVTDTGVGLSEAAQQELFKPFSRLDAEKMQIEGTGIGLVVCKDLLALMNGDVGMNSELGKGSTFWLELPSIRSGDDTSLET